MSLDSYTISDQATLIQYSPFEMNMKDTNIQTLTCGSIY